MERKRSSSTHAQHRRCKVVGGQRHAPAALLPGKTRDTNCTGDLVDLGVGLDRSGNSRAPTEVRTPDRPTRSMFVNTPSVYVAGSVG